MKLTLKYTIKYVSQCYKMYLPYIYIIYTYKYMIWYLYVYDMEYHTVGSSVKSL